MNTAFSAAQSMHMAKRFWSRLPLAKKVFLTCVALATSVSVGGNVLLYRAASSALHEQVRSKLIAVARTAANQIDPEVHRQIRGRSDESTATYRRLLGIVRKIKASNPEISEVYTMRRTPKPNTWAFVLDAECNKPPCTHVGDPYDVSDYPDMQAAFAGPTADSEITTDRWGTWLSGYAPIRDSHGRAVAIIGLDMSLAELSREKLVLARSAAKHIAAALLLACVLSSVLTRSALRRVRVFQDAAEQVRAGELEAAIPSAGADEIDRLADTFNRMISALRDNRERLMGMITVDPLTGVSNHRHFHETLELETERARRYNGSVSLLVMDVDCFTSINEEYGHAVGDSLLWQLASMLKERVRQIDHVARYGGDDFAVLLAETGSEAASLIAEELRAAIESHEFGAVPVAEIVSGMPLPDEARRVPLTVTIGLASCPEHHTEKNGLMMAAEIARLRAKNVRTNSVCVYETGRANLDPEELYRVLHEPNTAAIRSLAAAVDARDHYTSGHSERVAEYACQIAEILGYEQQMIDLLKVAGLLHDLGKIGVPDSILNKQGKLTDDEREAIKRHPSVGGEILGRAPQLDSILPAVVHHHERWDGGGYPSGLSELSIPLVARILAVADSFDAMTSNRPYRHAMTADEAVAELRAGAGTQFDPDMAEALAAVATGGQLEEAA